MSKKAEKRTLSQIFTGTNTVKYGPFKVRKQPQADWREAAAFVNGQEISLPEESIKTLALLVANKGKPVGYPDLEWPKTYRPGSYVNAFRDRVRRLKAAIGQIDENLADLVTAANPVRCQGEAGSNNRNLNGTYYIHLS